MVIKNYIEKDYDLSITHEILLNEKHRLEKILSLNNSDEVVNFYKPLIVNDKLGLTVGLENFRPDVVGKEYLFKHFIFRKDYIQQLLMVVEKNLLSIINLKRTAVKIKLNNEHKALKIMTEFSYLLEQGLLQNENFNQIQISAIRFKLFEALGLSDAEFARGRNEMFNRMPDNRFKYIETLISDVSNSIEKIPFRKKSNK